MASAAVKPRVSVAEYLASERASETKHEYRDGEVAAMPGASVSHNRIAADLLLELGIRLRGGPCEAFGSDMRVCVEVGGLYVYPDISIVCGGPRLLDTELDTLLNPCVVIEILSPSTEAYDRGEKFERYKGLKTLREYVLIAQDRLHVEHPARRGKRWTKTVMERAEDPLVLGSVGCEIPLAAIYARVPFA